jgi:hypothetical protein
MCKQVSSPEGILSRRKILRRYTNLLALLYWMYAVYRIPTDIGSSGLLRYGIIDSVGHYQTWMSAVFFSICQIAYYRIDMFAVRCIALVLSQNVCFVD